MERWPPNTLCSSTYSDGNSRRPRRPVVTWSILLSAVIVELFNPSRVIVGSVRMGTASTHPVRPVNPLNWLLQHRQNRRAPRERQIVPQRRFARKDLAQQPVDQG